MKVFFYGAVRRKGGKEERRKGGKETLRCFPLQQTEIPVTGLSAAGITYSPNILFS
jgi:hypothetical protein